MYSYGSSDPHKATAVGSQSLTYDTRGNLTSHNGSTYTWDYRGQLATATTAQVTETYKYDFAGNRSKKSDTAANTTLYISPEYELRNGIRNAYVFAAGLKIATVTGNSTSTLTTTYHHSDHLSGASVDTNSSGAVIQTLDYFPYGETRLNIRSGSYNNPKKFTGKERDGDSGLYYYGARYYNSAIGRFISRDAWSGDVTDPQTLNKYSYVLNNPMKYVDPTGNSAVSALIEKAGNKLLGRILGPIGEFFTNTQTVYAPTINIPANLPITVDPPTITPTVVTASSVSASICAGSSACMASQGLSQDSSGGGGNQIQNTNSGNAGNNNSGNKKDDRPEGVPDDWIATPTKDNDGMIYKDPNNSHNYVRVMEGNPNSPNPAQQNPYVIHRQNGQALDKYGNQLPSGDLPEAHIPLNEFKFNP